MIDAQPGGMAANSYVTLAEAESYFADRLHVEPWTAATPEVKERALLMAARALERQRWQGARSTDAQAFCWPRTGVPGTADGEVPGAVRQAQCEEALALLTPDMVRRRMLQTQGVAQAQVAGAREAYRPCPEYRLLSADARQLVTPLLAVGARLVTDRAQEV